MPDLVKNDYALLLFVALRRFLQQGSVVAGSHGRPTVDVSMHNMSYYEVAIDLKYVLKHEYFHIYFCPFMSNDFLSLISGFRDVVLSFLSSEVAIDAFIGVLELLQGMSPCQKKTGSSQYL